jgi:hypothetical protein
MVAIDPIFIYKGCIAPATKLTIFYLIICCNAGCAIMGCRGNRDFPSKQYRQWQNILIAFYLTKFIYANAFYFRLKHRHSNCHYGLYPPDYSSGIKTKSELVVIVLIYFKFSSRLTKIALQQQMIFHSI